MAGNKIELLAPAGDREAFIAAIENGADAVYLGGKMFNARQSAGNFDAPQLKEVLDYAHVRDTRAYLAMNTLISDDEMQEALDFAKKAYAMGIDGIIVQDIGFAGLLRKLLPDVELHASTQMSIYNLEGVKVLEQLGFRRVVLARELSLTEIENIAQNTSLEIEVFVHGALCISYSGQCLMSSIIGGRSGNRGKCAQPCRLPYTLLGGIESNGGHRSDPGKYLLSPKDLCGVQHLSDLVKAGVNSLKIEGRMKNPEYVAIVIETYRKYLDGVYGLSNRVNRVDRRDMSRLTQVFNRGGFSKGYLYGKTGRDMMCFEKPKNWGVYLGEVISYDRASASVKVKLEQDLSMGDGIEIWNGENESPGTVVSYLGVNGRKVEGALKGSIVFIGDVTGKILKGNKVYKTSDKRLNAEARETFTGKYLRKTEIDGYISIYKGKPAVLQVSDSRGNNVLVESNTLAEAAVNRPLSRERIFEQITKTGNTPFKFNRLEIKLDDNVSISVSDLNNLRREALERLEGVAVKKYERIIDNETVETENIFSYFPGNSRNSRKFSTQDNEKIKISVYMYKWDWKIDASRFGADRIYLPFSSLLDRKNMDKILEFTRGGMEVFVWLPIVTRGNYDKLIKQRLGEIVSAGVNGILVANIGSISYVEGIGNIKLAADYSFNIFNSSSVHQLSQLGPHSITLSPEITLQQLQKISNAYKVPLELIVYGRLPLMTSDYCPVGSTAGDYRKGTSCSSPCTRGAYRLKDRKGMEFPVLCDRIDCRSTILNSNVLFIPDDLHRLKMSGVESVRLHIYDETPDEVEELVNLHRHIINGDKRYAGKYEEFINTIKQKGFTKGHFFRGV